MGFVRISLGRRPESGAGAAEAEVWVDADAVVGVERVPTTAGDRVRAILSDGSRFPTPLTVYELLEAIEQGRAHGARRVLRP